MITVVKISGKPMAAPHESSELWDALGAFVGKVVLVHGGGVQLDAMFDRLAIPVIRRDGIRLTSEEAMPIVAGVLAGTVNQSLVGVLRASGVPAVGLTLASFGMLDTEVASGIGGRVGEVTGGDCVTIRTLLEAGVVPVVASIGVDSFGGLLNINADDAAAGVAVALRAGRVVFLTDTDGVLDADGKAFSRIDVSRVEDLIAGGVVTGGMAAKVRSIAALKSRLPGGMCVADWHHAAAAIRGDAGVGTAFQGRSEDGAAG